MAAYNIIIKLFSDWEIETLILLSFALQLLLFFSGGLRRRHNHMLLRIMIWLSYLSADFIAVYALGHLSRNLPTSSTTDDNYHKPIHQLTLLWAPFLLIHLGGQDTVTAFSLEDNELWLRHLLTLLCQACLVVFVLWKLVALAHHQLVISAAFLFVAGIIKYGERVWALKLGSKEGLRISTSAEVRDCHGVEESERRSTYQATVRHSALRTERGVQDLFAGRGILGMDDLIRTDFLGELKFLYHDEEAQRGDGQMNFFKRLEIELSIMYDKLFTKSRVIRTRPGTILRCVSLASTVVAFVIYVNLMMSSSADAEQTAALYNSGYRRSRVDAAITYVLFVGAFFLEACSFFLAMMSPWAWPFLGARAGWCSRVLLTRVVWPIFVRIHPETKPWWSNSMGQYNFLSTFSSIAADNMWSTVIAKMAGTFGTKELWNKIHNTEHAKVSREIKELIRELLHEPDLWSRPEPILVPESYKSVLCLPFEDLLLSLHVWTDVVVHKADKSMNSSDLMPADKETRCRLMDTCKRLSDYMFYLLMELPAMLPVRGNVPDIMGSMENAAASMWANDGSHKDYYLENLPPNYDGPGRLFWCNQSPLLRQHWGVHAELERLEQVWLRILLYAAGKSRPEEHARRLCMGGELITFVWLLMAHRAMGDVNTNFSLIEHDGDPAERHLFYW